MTVELKPNRQITQLTVNDILQWCQAAIREGHGNRYVLLSSDDEVNELHPVWNGFSLPCRQDAGIISNSQVNDINKLIILS